MNSRPSRHMRQATRRQFLITTSASRSRRDCEETCETITRKASSFLLRVSHDGYTRSMVTRLFSLFVALAIGGAPVALEACQIACASTSVHPMAAHDARQDHRHHATAASGSCHEQPATPHHLSSQAPPCDHDAEATEASIIPARTSDGVLPYAAAAPLVADVVLGAASTLVPTRQSTLPDRLEIRLASPLRI